MWGWCKFIVLVPGVVLGYTKHVNKTMRRGFTLIELLVVISIVGLLSSVVLSSVNSARGKMDNTQRERVVEEYVKALNLYYHDNGGNYPPDSGCLGEYSDNLCGVDNDTLVSTSLNSALAPYFGNSTSNLPTGKPFSVGTVILTISEGPLYVSTPDPVLVWYLKKPAGSTPTCALGALRLATTVRIYCTLYLSI